MAAGENDGLDDLGRRKRPRSNRVPEVIEGEAVALPPDPVVEPAPASPPEPTPTPETASQQAPEPVLDPAPTPAASADPVPRLWPPQSVAANITSSNISLAFNHCCKEFLWVIREDRMKAAREWFNFSNALKNNGGEPGIMSQDPLCTALIRLDGYDRFHTRGARYFRLTQPYQRHTVVPNDYIYLYSFSLRPEEEQPSGSINCSKFDDIVLHLTYDTDIVSYDRTVYVYATNYNVVRITGGLAGLAFLA